MTYEKDIPDYAMVPAKEIKEKAITPITKGAIYSPVLLTNISEKPKMNLTIEEDILVPDIKPDLCEILLIDGKVSLTNNYGEEIADGEDYINISGEIEFQTLYLPEKREGNSPVISVQTRLPFSDRWHAPFSSGSIVLPECSVEKIEYMVINERKYRVKIILCITAREYRNTKIDFFEGLSSDDIQTLKETIEISNISHRKKDNLSIKEDILPKDEYHPESILKQDLSIVENYKQITDDKVVINGFIYVNLLYYAEADDGSHTPDCIKQMQERIEFTQFIPLSPNGQNTGCRVSFDDTQLKLKLTQDEDGNDVFRLEGDILTYVELYKTLSKEIVTDAYHKEKDFVCEFLEETGRTFVASANCESSMREIISLENSGKEIEHILYSTGEISTCESRCERGKLVTEGKVMAKALCHSVGDSNDVFSIKEPLSFKVISSLPQLLGNEFAAHKVYIKDLWAEKINSKQIEFNATIIVCAEIMRPTPFKILINPAFEENGDKKEYPAMAVYICKSSDSIWHIAKRFKTSPESVTKLNSIDDAGLKEGQKLLIIK